MAQYTKDFTVRYKRNYHESISLHNTIPIYSGGFEALKNSLFPSDFSRHSEAEEPNWRFALEPFLMFATRPLNKFMLYIKDGDKQAHTTAKEPAEFIEHVRVGLSCCIDSIRLDWEAHQDNIDRGGSCVR